MKTDRRQDAPPLEMAPRLRTLLNAAVDSVLLLEPDGTILLINEAAANRLGMTAEAARGNSFWNLMPAEGTRLRKQKWNHALHTGRPVRFTENREEHWTDLIFHPVIDPDGEIRSVVVYARDISEFKKTEKALRKSRERLELSLWGSESSWWDWNVQTGRVDFDRRKVEMLGYTPPEIRPHVEVFIDLIHPDDRERAMEAMRAHLSGQSDHYEVRNRIRTKDNNWKLFQDRGAVVETDAAGEPARVTGTVQDITEIRRADLERIFTLSADLFSIFRFDGRIRQVNPASRRTLGWNEAEMTARRISDFIHPEDQKPFQNAMVRLLRDETVLDCELRFQRKGGDYIWFSSNFFPLKPRDRIFGISRDVTDRKQALDEQRRYRHDLETAVKHRTLELEETNRRLKNEIEERRKIEKALQEAKETAEAASRAKSDFLARMSHEIRTPMNAVIGMTEVALQTELTPEQREYIDIVKTSAEHLLDIINSILDLSKVEAGKIEINSVDFDLSALLRNTLSTLAVTAQKKNISLNLETELPNPCCLKGDPARLRQILVNLVGNAIKFTESGGVDLRAVPTEAYDLAISAKAVQTVLFSVTDTGIGIPEEKQEAVFSDFYQIDNREGRRYGGTGLGLSISRMLVGRMGGKIWLESESGRGSTFYLYIPFLAGDCGETESIDNTTNISDHPEPLTLLVVEDNEMNRMVATAILDRMGHRLITATGGEEALVLLKTHPVDLILMDLEMPGIDGFETTRRISNDEAGPSNRDVPIFAMTAHAVFGYKEQCLQAGMNDFISKPIRSRELSDIIKRHFFEGISMTKPEKPHQPTAPDANVFDKQTLLKLVGEDEALLKDILGDFPEMAAESLNQLEAALKAGDAERARREAHSMKGMASNISGNQVRDLAGLIEEDAAGRDLETAGHRVKQLRESLHRLVAAMRQAGLVE